MNKNLLLSLILCTVLINMGCRDKKESPALISTKLISDTPSGTATQPIAAVNLSKDTAAFLPKGYIIFERVSGDINKDGLAECILIIKGTDTSNIITHEYRGRLDRNRRGIIILFNKNDRFELAAKNYDCFSSENEEGGVYYAPELSVESKNGNLLIGYAHGRYGYWTYTFRYANGDFEMIGYDASSSNGPVIDRETSINFLTRKKQTRKNTNENAESGEEVFTESWKTISIKQLTRLSQIKDFDDMNMHEL